MLPLLTIRARPVPAADAAHLPDEFPSVFSDSTSAVMQRHWLWPKGRDGYFKVPSKLNSFSLDVGFNRGAVMIADWVYVNKTYLGLIVKPSPPPLVEQTV